MDFLEWVDLTDADHIDALRHWVRVGTFPEGFIPGNVQMGTHWIPGLLGLMAKAFLDITTVSRVTILPDLPLPPDHLPASDPSCIEVCVGGASDVTTQVLDIIARTFKSNGNEVFLTKGRRLRPDSASISRRSIILSYQ